jgi:hypothetical protein
MDVAEFQLGLAVRLAGNPKRAIPAYLATSLHFDPVAEIFATCNLNARMEAYALPPQMGKPQLFLNGPHQRIGLPTAQIEKR